jgi:hypothetical protein
MNFSDVFTEILSRKDRAKSRLRYIITGAISGIISTLLFTIIHHIFISDIWFSIVIMLAAGIFCGACVAWCYSQLDCRKSLWSWIRYNLLFDILLMLLGLVSVLVFEPITTVAAAIAANGPPNALIKQALPLTAVYTLLMSIIIHQLYGKKWKDFGLIFLTCIIVVTLLGLNISVIGLVSFAGSSIFLIIKLFVLILVINTSYVSVFALFEKLI